MAGNGLVVYLEMSKPLGQIGHEGHDAPQGSRQLGSVMEETTASSDFRLRLNDLIKATGVRAPRIERLLRGQVTAVRRTTVYNWLDGSSLPLSVESLLAVVHVCVEHAEVKVSPAALRSDREWAMLLAQAKQERDSRAEGSRRSSQRRPSERDAGGPGTPPSWEALHPAEASDRLTRLDKRDPDRAVAELYAMRPDIAGAALERMNHSRALSLLARVQPTWLSKCAVEYHWFRQQIHQMPADRGADAFRSLAWRSPQDAAWAINRMPTNQAIHFLDLMESHTGLKAVLSLIREEDIDQLLDLMSPRCTTLALAAHADWAVYMMVDADQRRWQTIIGRIGPDGLTQVLSAASTGYLARLVTTLDLTEAATWMGRMGAVQAADVLGAIDPVRIAAFVRDLDRSRAVWWLARIPANRAAKVLERVKPADAAALIGYLQPEQAARCLDEMPAAGAARVLAASLDLLDPAQVTAIVQQMDSGRASEALKIIGPEKYVPLLKQAGPELVNALLAASLRSATGLPADHIVAAVCASTRELADLLTVNTPDIAGKVVDALPVEDAADALLMMDTNHAHQVLRLLQRYESREDPRYFSRPVDRFSGKQIDVLKAIEQLDKAKADRLAELLGLVPKDPAPEDPAPKESSEWVPWEMPPDRLKET